MSIDAEHPVPPDSVNAHVSLEEPAIELSRIYAIEAPKLQRYFRARLRGSDDIGDLVHETFVRLLGALDTGNPLRPGAYLQRIARNLLFNRTKRLENRLAGFHMSFDECYELATPPNQGEEIEVEDMMRIYRKALSELPDKTRQAFLLHRVDELTYREIGERLGISIPTVQYHIARALAHIDAALEQE
ncbi:RNA polymerase sigma factor [Sphingobium baderi]|uniref:RNA polymerase sigma factor n=1 Tax=Sphingobium baderi TaxID=1332080 RepID=UPI0009E7E3FB|nr:RNA polymerase sigma factor [Sphingobium baderi]